METSWTSSRPEHTYQALRHDIGADVVIIGGGMAGVVSAYMLTRAGKKVVLLERGTIGDGVTHMTTAFVTQIIDTGLSELIKMFGTHEAKLIVQSGGAAIDTIQEIVEREHIACEFSRCSAYIYARTKGQFRKLKAHHVAAGHLGLQTTLAEKGKLPFPHAGYLEVMGQAKFQPLLFLHGVAQAAVAAGARIFEHTEVVSMSDAGPVKVVTAHGAVQAVDSIVTTHIPFNKPKALRFKKALYRSYVLEAHVPHTDLLDALYWDQSNPYTYFRVDRHSGGTRIILGGADHRADIPQSVERKMRFLERQLKDVLSGAPYTLTHTWHGPIVESVDGLPFIGAYAPHRYLATAFSGNGMTYSVVSALLLGDLVSGHSNPWTTLYDPTRKMTLYRLYRKGVDYMKEFFGGVL